MTKTDPGTNGNHDGSERKRAEAALRETEERFRAIFETARDCIFVKDSDLRYTHVNPAMAELFGRPESELIGVTDDELFEQDTVVRVRETDLRVLAGEIREEVNTSIVGGVEYVFHAVKVPLRDVNGEVTGLCGIARDITGLDRAESVERVMGGILHAAASSADLKTLIERIRELLGTLIDTTNFYVALYDDSTGYSFPFYADEYDAIEKFGPEPMPKSLTDYVRRTGEPALVDADKFAELQRQGEVHLVGTDSKQWLGAPLITDRGVIGIVSVQSYHDETLYSKKDLELLHYAAGTISIAVERKRADEQRRALEAKVLQIQKMESLGVLAGGIAHEFNNLLQGILGGTGLAAQLLPPSSPVKRQLELIEKAANDAAKLTGQMLAYSGKGGFMMEEIDLNRLLEEMRSFVEASVSDGIELRLDLQVELPPVKADATEFSQVVMNLVSNASEAIGDDDGVISLVTRTVECDRAMLDETYLGEHLPEGGYVVLEVADTGCGMDADTQAKIFDPFFSTKFTGRGLGLAAVLGIVRSLRGAVQVDSDPGRGTTIGVLIPTLVEPQIVERVSQVTPVGRRGAETVLVVDDDSVVRSLTQQMLEEAGFEVLTAADGREAVDAFRASPATIDVVLLDMTMPRLDGEAAFIELRNVRPDVRVVVSSGYSEQDAMDRFRGPRPAGYLQKPYRMTELVETVCSVFAGHEVEK
jgi:PAS domain S-box-containing protein